MKWSAPRGRDPKVMGHHSPNYRWDVHKHRLFLLIPVWAKGTGISLRVLHKHLLCHRQAKEARAWVEVEGRAHKPRLQGPRGVSTLLHLRLSLQISRLFRVLLYSLVYGQEYCLILVHLILLLMHHM